MTETNWLPGIVVLALGLLGAVGYFLFARKRGPTLVSADSLSDLDRRAQTLLDQLKELQADRHHLDDRQFEAEKRRLEREAALALRDKDEQARRPKAPAPSPSKPSRPPTWFGAHPQLTGALWGGGVVLFFVALGIFLSQEQKPRSERQEMTGKPPEGASSSGEQNDSGLRALMERLSREPENVELMVEISHQMLNQQQWDEAARLTERALGVDPFHVRSRIHRAFLKAVKGNMDGSAKDLLHLADAYPDAQEALLYLGFISMQRQDPKSALESFERYMAEAPPERQPVQLREAISSLRKQLGGPAN